MESVELKVSFEMDLKSNVFLVTRDILSFRDFEYIVVCPKLASIWQNRCKNLSMSTNPYYTGPECPSFWLQFKF